MNGPRRGGKRVGLRRYSGWILAVVVPALALVAVVYGFPKLVHGALELRNTHQGFRPVHALAAGVLLLWLGCVVAYLIWAIRRYNVNYGLSDEEWMLIQPDVYAPEDERQDYLDRRHEMIRSHRELRARPFDDEALAPAAVPGNGNGSRNGEVPPLLKEPAANPYERDSFGLPPGTVRGLLALTALVMFLVVEMVNLFDGSLEKSFAELVIGFQMVLAFYFGARAVEVLQTREREGEEKAAPAAKAQEAAASPPEAARPAQPTAVAEAAPATPVDAPAQALSAPSERAILPARLNADRLASMVVPVAATQAAPPVQVGGLAGAPLEKRVLALTASFETGLGFPGCFGALAGNFDGHGISFGALQWNIGTGSLQPLLRHMRNEHDDVVRNALGAPLRTSLYRMLDASSRAEQLEWARSIQLTRRSSRGGTVWVVNDAWKEALRALGTHPDMMELQVHEALNRFQIALANCAHFGLSSERAVALFFDINVQNGKVNVAGAGDRIRAQIAEIDPKASAEDREVAKLLIVARRRAEVSRPEWQADVLARKETIANGAGRVHGRRYDLEADYSISLGPAAGMNAPPPPMLGLVA